MKYYRRIITVAVLRERLADVFDQSLHNLLHDEVSGRILVVILLVRYTL